MTDKRARHVSPTGRVGFYSLRRKVLAGLVASYELTNGSAVPITPVELDSICSVGRY